MATTNDPIIVHQKFCDSFMLHWPLCDEYKEDVYSAHRLEHCWKAVSDYYLTHTPLWLWAIEVAFWVFSWFKSLYITLRQLYAHMYKMFTKHSNEKQQTNIRLSSSKIFCFDENILDCLMARTFYTLKNNRNLFLITTLVNTFHFTVRQNVKFPLFIFILL